MALEKIISTDSLNSGKDKINKLISITNNTLSNVLSGQISLTVEHWSRAVTNELTLKGGTIVNTKNDVSFTVSRIENGATVSLINTWSKTYTLADDGVFVLRIRLDDDSDIRSKLDYLLQNIDISSLPKVIDSTILETETAELGFIKSTDVDDVIKSYGVNYIPLVAGTLTPTSPGITNAANPSLEGAAIIQAKAGDIIENIDPTNYLISIAANGVFVRTWSNTPFTVINDGEIRFKVKRVDGARFDPTQLNIVRKTRESEKLASISDVNSLASGEVIKYITLSGKDSNSGNSSVDAYQTLQKAIDSGATKIFIERGIYNQTLTRTGAMEKLSILPLNDNIYNQDSNSKLQKVVFLGAEKLTSLSQSGTIYKQALTAKPNFNEYFINGTVSQKTGTRPQYSALLWESKDFELDYAMKPVKTLAECEAEVGTFYWNGTEIFVNPKDINNNFYAPNIEAGLDLSNIKELTLDSVVFDYFTKINVNMDYCKKINLFNCESNHCGNGDGFSLDYTSGVLNSCKAYKNFIDGFNAHYFGDLLMNNCWGINNYDDGASPHEDCVMTVIGGIYRGNGKGGLSPASGARAYIYNAILESNDYGLYNSVAGYGTVSSGNLYLNNRVAVYNTKSQGLKSIGDKFVGNSKELSGDAYEKY